MRIIAGTLKGRRLNPPANLPVRPTTDMAREGLFNILNNYVEFADCSVLDLFAGTGAVSLEFLSRGAREVTSVDIDAKCTDYIKAEVARLGVVGMRVVRADVFDLLKRANRKFDLVFADPPYALERLPQLPTLVMESGLVAEGGILVVEHPHEYSFEDLPHFWQQRAYGKVNFSFFAMELNN